MGEVVTRRHRPDETILTNCTCPLFPSIYARAGVPAYWLVDLIENQIEVYSELGGAGREIEYRHKSILGAGDPISFGIPGHPVIEHPVIKMSVADLLP